MTYLQTVSVELDARVQNSRCFRRWLTYFSEGCKRPRVESPQMQPQDENSKFRDEERRQGWRERNQFNELTPNERPLSPGILSPSFSLFPSLSPYRFFSTRRSKAMRAADILYRGQTQLGSGPRLSVYRYITTGGLARQIHPRERRRAINHVLLDSGVGPTNLAGKVIVCPIRDAGGDGEALPGGVSRETIGESHRWSAVQTNNLIRSPTDKASSFSLFPSLAFSFCRSLLLFCLPRRLSDSPSQISTESISRILYRFRTHRRVHFSWCIRRHSTCSV